MKTQYQPVAFKMNVEPCTFDTIPNVIILNVFDYVFIAVQFWVDLKSNWKLKNGEKNAASIKRAIATANGKSIASMCAAFQAFKVIQQAAFWYSSINSTNFLLSFISRCSSWKRSNFNKNYIFSVRKHSIWFQAAIPPLPPTTTTMMMMMLSFDGEESKVAKAVAKTTVALEQLRTIEANNFDYNVCASRQNDAQHLRYPNKTKQNTTQKY